MDRLYRNNQLAFALVWIGSYVVLLSTADGLSEQLGTAKLLTAPLCILLSIVLLGWMGRHGHLQTYGLCRPRGSARSFLYYLPLVLLVSVNLWGGIRMNHSPAECILYIVSMLFVGLLEELIFRGLLFKALCRDSMKTAVILSSVTFGFGHLVNLLHGAPVAATLLQIVYAAAAGLLFTVLFLRSGSLIPCIAAHSGLNALSAFAAEGSQLFQMATALVLTVIALAYTLWIWKKTAP